jgi:hypothetical protein
LSGHHGVKPSTGHKTQLIVGIALLMALVQLVYVAYIGLPVLYAKIKWQGFLVIGLFIALCFFIPQLWILLLAVAVATTLIWMDS